MKKIAILMVLAIFLLTGCVASVGEISVNPDGSGSCVIFAGFEAEAYLDFAAQMAEDGELEPDDEEFTEFSYNGNSYLGEISSFSFENLDELNETLLYSGESGDQSIDTGDITFAAADGKITMTVSATAETGSTESAEEMLSADADEETKAEIEAMMETAVAVYSVTFPENVTMTEDAQSDAITIEANKLTIDFIALSKELEGKQAVFTFESEGYVTPEPSDLTFTDVTKDDWFYSQITEMVDMGLFKGKAPGLFCPQDTMTKAEFLTVCAHVLYPKPELNLYSGNPDIWWDKYYNACSEYGIVTEDMFLYETMNEGISREEMAYAAFVIYENSCGFDYPELEEIIAAIPDFDEISDDLKEYTAYAYSLGILRGTDDKGTFNPKGTLTRAEGSTVIYNLVKEKNPCLN